MAIKISGINIVDNNQGLRITGVSTFTTGPVIIGAATSTGTASQPLQVTGGGYVSGSVGIGTTNPGRALDVNGTVRIRGGLYDVNDQVGAGNSVLLSTGSGISWTPIATAALQGVQGVQGIQGVQGRQGIQGTQGLQGIQGIQGIQGTQGIQGVQGTQGLQGIQGIQGTQGLQGIQGIQGIQGRQGIQGVQGTQGLQGIQGVQGTQGLQGIQGITGPVAGSANQVVYKDGSNVAAGSTNFLFLNNSTLIVGTGTSTGTASQPLQVTGGAYVSGSVGIGTTNPSQTLHVQGDARITGAFRDSTNSPGTSGQVLQSTVSGTQWTTAAAGGGSGKFDTTIDNVLYVQPTGTLDIVGVGTTTTQITTLPAGSTKYLIHSLHVTNISNGDAEITAGFVMNARKVPASISVSVGSSGGPGIHTFTVGSASSITVGMAVTGTGNIGETTGIGSTAGFQFNTYVTSVDGTTITLNKPMSGRATGTLFFSPVSDVVSRLPVPVGSAVELLKQPMILNALDSIVLQSTGAGSGIGSTSTAAITQAANSNFLTVTAGAAITNFLASGMLIQPTGSNTGIQTNTFVGVGYTPGALSIPITRPATVGIASTSLSFTEVVVPQDGALQVTVVYQSSTDTSYQNGTGTVVAISSNTTSVTAGLSTIPVAYYGTGNTYPSVVQSIRVSNISDGIIYPGGDYPVSVGIGNSDTIFSWLAYNMVIPKNSSIELCEAPKRLGIGQSIFAITNTPYAIEIQVAGKQKTS